MPAHPAVLSKLTDRAFDDALKTALWSDVDYEAFMHPDNAERTLARLLLMKNSVEYQLGSFPDKSEWRLRTRKLLSKIQARYTATKRAMTTHNRNISATATIMEIKWGQRCFQLAQALEGSSADGKLDQIVINEEAGLTAREWLKIRRANIAKKALRADTNNPFTTPQEETH